MIYTSSTDRLAILVDPARILPSISDVMNTTMQCLVLSANFISMISIHGAFVALYQFPLQFMHALDVTRFSCREYIDNTWCPSMAQRWCYVDACLETSLIAHVVLIDYLKVVVCFQGAMYLSSPPSLHYLSVISLTLRIILHILMVINVFKWM
jgi:hypothetical protein